MARLDHAHRGRRLADMAGRADHLQSFGFELLDRVGAALVVGQMVDRDGRARSRQDGRGRETDTRCRARHQRGLAVNS